jgi:3D (Asp-Asp-Asp) domain-containing protein
MAFRVATFSVSAYTDAEGVWPYAGLMASGYQTRQGVVACGPDFSFGTIFLIEGKLYICMDRGSAITNQHLDIWYASYPAAIEAGRKTVEVLFFP